MQFYLQEGALLPLVLSAHVPLVKSCCISFPQDTTLTTEITLYVWHHPNSKSTFIQMGTQGLIKLQSNNMSVKRYQ